MTLHFQFALRSHDSTLNKALGGSGGQHASEVKAVRLIRGDRRDAAAQPLASETPE